VIGHESNGKIEGMSCILNNQNYSPSPQSRVLTSRIVLGSLRVLSGSSLSDRMLLFACLRPAPVSQACCNPRSFAKRRVKRCLSGLTSLVRFQTVWNCEPQLRTYRVVRARTVCLRPENQDRDVSRSPGARRNCRGSSVNLSVRVRHVVERRNKPL
jgi:hypothetical protein